MDNDSSGIEDHLKGIYIKVFVFYGGETITDKERERVLPWDCVVDGWVAGRR